MATRGSFVLAAFPTTYGDSDLLRTDFNRRISWPDIGIFLQICGQKFRPQICKLLLVNFKHIVTWLPLMATIFCRTCPNRSASCPGSHYPKHVLSPYPLPIPALCNTRPTLTETISHPLTILSVPRTASAQAGPSHYSTTPLSAPRLYTLSTPARRSSPPCPSGGTS